MLKKFIAHTLLLPYNTLCFLMSFGLAFVGGATRIQTQKLAESIENNRKSRGLFIFTQFVVVGSTIYSQKGVAILGGISFLAISSLGKYLLWKNDNTAFQSTSTSDYQSQSNNYTPTNLQQSDNLYQQQQLDNQKRNEDDYQRRRQQEYYERQQRESQQRHDEQMRRDEESRRRNWEEQDRRNEEDRKRWGRF